MFKVIVFAVLWHLSLAQVAEKWSVYTNDDGLFYGCRNYVVESVSYAEGYENYGAYCTDINALASLLSCYINLGKNETERYKAPIEQCSLYYEAEIDLQNFTDAYQHLYEYGVTLQLLKDRDYNLTNEILTVPVFVEVEDSELWVKAETHFLKVYSDSSYLGFATVAYWVAICLIGAAANWSMILFPRLRLCFNGPLSKFWRKHVALPALVSKKVAVPAKIGIISFLIPKRIESIVSILFFAFLVGVNTAEIKAIPGDPIFEATSTAIIIYVADRTAIVCTILIPVLLLFGGRNNFLMWLTRWKYSTFLGYHRWIGRWIVVLAFIHTITYTKYFIIEDEYAELMAETYVIWGLVAVICGSLILFQGLLYLRRKWYESFLVIHILLAIFFVVGTWYHVISLGFGQFMYAAFAIWAFDRVLRLVRLVYFGFPLAKVTLLYDRLEVVVPRPAHWKPTPGGYAWLHFSHKLYFWQSHPFTYVYDNDTVTFYCTIHSGLTKIIAEKLLVTPGKSTLIRVGVEGPYGFSNPISRHSDVVFVAGGNGIPGPLSEFKEALNSNNGRQRLIFNWIIKDVLIFEEMKNQFNGLCAENAKINIHITRPCSVESFHLNSSKEDLQISSKSENFDPILLLQSEYPGLNFFTGRPDLEDLVKENLSNSSNSVAFVCCGPARMVDDLRSYVVDNIGETQKRVDFYDTLEVWT